ncbi:MAG: 2-hydroxyacid dehydrogenase [Phycisphaeraceae bacterium]
MKVAVFGTKPYDQHWLENVNAEQGQPHQLSFFEPRLTLTNLPLINSHDAVCVFVNDVVNAPVLQALHERGVKVVALRCAGFNNVDLDTAKRLGIAVVRVPAYSPFAVAEHTVGLILALNRKIHRAFNRVREGNFEINSLIGFDLHGKTIGVMGTGRIGAVFAKIMLGFGCRILAHDPQPNPELEQLGVRYVSWDELCAESRIISMHCPLTPQTHHIVSHDAIDRMPDGVMLINTSRGALVDSRALIAALKSGKLGSVALDVYEEEADVFFEDLSDRVLQDDVLARLLSFPNVLITSHQAFFTEEAMQQIAETTLANLTACEQNQPIADNTLT